MAVERHVAAPPSTNQLCVKTNNNKNVAEKINSSSDDIRRMKGREYSILPRTQSDLLMARNMKRFRKCRVWTVNSSIIREPDANMYSSGVDCAERNQTVANKPEVTNSMTKKRGLIRLKESMSR